MSFEVAGKGVAQGHDCAEHDEDGHQAGSDVLGKIANASTNPHHVKAGEADRERGHDVKAPIPAMQEREPGRGSAGSAETFRRG